ncbi:hypothetical protein JL721_11037 [Aureococcus anophagefferens]|nr:hypothetical protein JL721_11037 [Aureococcus anophagefferens]
MYALARFDPAETADADLLILDETVNDIFTNKEESRNYHPYARIRGAVELLARLDLRRQRLQSGWEYDASDDVRRGLAEMPRIRFPVAFGTRPGLVLSVMSSYANFGPGCFWLERSGAASLDVATAAVHAGRALRDHCWTVKTKPGSYEKNGVHEFLCHKVLAHSITLPFIVDGHWGDRRPSFNPPNADQPLSPPNTTDVLVFVAYPPSDAKDLRLGAKVRLMAIETC